MGQSFRQFSVAKERGRLKQIIHHLERSCLLACHSQCHSQMHAHDSNASHQTLLPRRKQTKKLNFVRKNNDTVMLHQIVKRHHVALDF